MPLRFSRERRLYSPVQSTGMARIHPADALQRRPRLPDDLAERIDAARGDVSFTRWVVRACELRLAGTLEAAGGIASGSGMAAKRAPKSRELGTDAPPSPRAPRKPKAQKSPPAAPTPEVAPGPPEEPTPADQESPGPEMPSAVQLMNKAGVTLSMARRWLESGEWAMYWP